MNIEKLAIERASMYETEQNKIVRIIFSGIEQLEAFAKAYAQHSMTSEAVAIYKPASEWGASTIQASKIDWIGDIPTVETKLYTHAPNTAQQQTEPVAYCVYFPDEPRQDYCQSLDELTDALTNERHEITPLFTHPPATVPEGYALVPIEPTDEMINVVLDFDYEWTNNFAPSKSDRLGVYKAMLSASPTPPNAVPLEGCGKLLNALRVSVKNSQEMFDELHLAKACSGLMPMFSKRISESEQAIAEAEGK